MPVIPLRQVPSTNVHSVGYDAESRTLRVKFLNGDTWDYADVPPDAHKRLMNAPSIGSVIHRHIKQNFAGKKVEL